MTTLKKSVQRLRQFLRPQERPLFAASRARGILPPPRFIDCYELEDRTLLSATPLGVETLVNSTTADSQQTFAETPQAVAADANGNYVAVWSSLNQDGSGWGVYAQRFNSAGVAQGSELPVNTATATDQQYAAVAMDANGDFVVVWTTDAAGDSGVRAQRFDASGAAQGGEVQVNTFTTDDQTWASVAMDDNGNFVITWSSINQDGGGWGIYAERYDSSGVGQGDFLVNTATTNGDQIYSQVAMDADGDFVITWETDLQLGTGLGVFGQRYDAAGTAQGGEFLINTTTAGDQRSASVDMDAAGNFVVAWTSENQDGSGAGIYARRYDSAGNPLSGESLVNSTTSGDQDYSRVSVNASGDFVVTWSSFDQDAAGTWGVYAKKFAASGAVEEAEFRVNSTVAGDQRYSSVAMMPNNTAVFVWSGNGAGDADGVFMQRYNFNDAPVVATTGSALVYLENAGAVAVDGGLTVTDSDNVSLTGATITISNNYVNGQDTLAFTDQSGITGNWNAGSGTLTLSGASSVANYQAALRSITYTNNSDNPATATRTVSFVVSDTTATSSAATRDINITAVNDAPVLASVEGAALAYTENGSSPVTSSITVADVDNAVLSSATVQITGNYVLGQDLLTFTNTANITGTWDAATGTLTLNGVDSLANYQAALRSVGYTNTSDNPNTATRTASFRASDGTSNSNTQTRDVTIAAVNDAPVNIIPGPQSTGEGTPLVFSAGAGNQIWISDVDAGAGTVHLALAATSGTLSLSQTTGLNFIAGDGTADASMSFTGTVGAINAALDGLTFTPSAGFAGAASVQILTDDQGNTGSGGVLVDNDVVSITVGAINDAPTISAPGSQTTSGSTLEFSTSQGNSITLADIDASGAVVELVLSGINGTMTLGATTGIAFVEGTGASDSRMVLRGTLADLNAALDGLSFHSSGLAAQLNIALNDLGNTGAGGAASASQTIDIGQTLPPPPPASPAPPDDGGASAGDGSRNDNDDTQDADGDLSSTPALVAPPPRSVDAGSLDRPSGARSIAQQSAAVSASFVAAANQSNRITTVDLEADDYRSLTQGDANRAKATFVDTSPLLGDSANEAMLWNELREVHEALESVFTTPWTFGAIAGLGALSAGYVLWGLQAGSLVTSALSSLPVWGSFDPLPVLEFWERDSKRKERQHPDDDESLLESEPRLTAV